MEFFRNPNAVPVSARTGEGFETLAYRVSEALSRAFCDIDVDTFNGRIRNCFGPKAERTSRYAPGWGLSFAEGDGDGRVDRTGGRRDPL